MEKFVEERLAICKSCPIMRLTEFGMKCDDRKYISPDGTQGSFFNKAGWKRGCGCFLSRKCANINNHCVCGKW